MSILANSRYVNSTVINVTGPEGNTVQVIVPSPAVSWTFSFTSHTWTDQDTVDLLAWTYYGDPTLWWKIGDANPEIMSWFTVQPGTVIRIPTASS